MPLEIFDLDAQATTPLDPAVLDVMLPFLKGKHWNPHTTHRGARQTKAALDIARMQVAALLDAKPEEVHFTSGATEANNLALKGTLIEKRGDRRQLVTFATEHSCVLESARHLARLGVPVAILPVLPNGMPDMDAYRAALGPETALVSAMRVNNEIGSIWPIAEMATLAKKAGALFHCDAAQAYGKIDCRVTAGLQGADMVSMTAHKIYGPKGIGALWVKSGTPLTVQLDGGGQEEVRSGTQSPALAAGFGMAAALCAQKMDADFDHVSTLASIARQTLSAVPHAINGPSGDKRWPGNLSVTFTDVDSSQLFAKLPNIALSSGSACSSGAGRPSHVLTALGLADTAMRQTVRIGWGRFTPEAGFKAALQDIVEAVRDLQG